MSTRKRSEARENGWFEVIPRRFFRYPTWSFSAYVGLGYVFAAVLHHVIWSQGQQVETVFTNFGLGLARPTPLVALWLFVITGVVVTATLHALLRRLTVGGGAVELVFWGTAVSVGASWLPWLFASSVVTTLFLFLYGMIGVTGFALTRRVLREREPRARAARFDPWKMFANATKACAAVVAVVLGAIATSILLPWRDTEVERPELFRYAILAAWMIAGMLAFILMPLFVKALETPPSEDVELEPPGPV
jgi:hypothetical protein